MRVCVYVCVCVCFPPLAKILRAPWKVGFPAPSHSDSLSTSLSSENRADDHCQQRHCVGRNRRSVGLQHHIRTWQYHRTCAGDHANSCCNSAVVLILDGEGGRLCNFCKTRFCFPPYFHLKRYCLCMCGSCFLFFLFLSFSCAFSPSVFLFLP